MRGDRDVTLIWELCPFSSSTNNKLQEYAISFLFPSLCHFAHSLGKTQRRVRKSEERRKRVLPPPPCPCGLWVLSMRWKGEHALATILFSQHLCSFAGEELTRGKSWYFISFSSFRSFLGGLSFPHLGLPKEYSMSARMKGNN